jgi:DNA repair protein RadC
VSRSTRDAAFHLDTGKPPAFVIASVNAIEVNVMFKNLQNYDLFPENVKDEADSLVADANGNYQFNQAVSPQIIVDLAFQILDKDIHGEALSNPQQTRNYLRLRLGTRECEYFSVLFLDNRHRVIAIEDMFRGTIDGASIYPREVVKAALSHNAAAVVFAHNHPSGMAEPSQADRAITKRLTEALALVDIRVLDHFVIAASESVSFAERGLL